MNKQSQKEKFVILCTSLFLAMIVIVVVKGCVEYKFQTQGIFHPTGVEPVFTAAPPPANGRGPGLLLLDAIEQVESGGNTNAIGDSGAAVGCLQIHKIMVDDVNRIIGYDTFTYKDRLDRDKSRIMARIYFDHYCKGKSDEYKARSWNGGPTGWKKEATKAYWVKVKKVLERNSDARSKNI